MERHNLVVRLKTGKLQLSKEQEDMIEKEVAYRLGGFA